MKNIHLLPTDKPSRLGYLTKKGKEVYKDLRLFDTLMPNILDSENQHIYITSDEQIREGDWVFNLKSKQVYFITIIEEVVFYEKKIVLTTDSKLAPDVQKIDDTFLEWFVKNPNCEEVDVTKGSTVIDNWADNDKDKWRVKYYIHIPTEEPKQERTFTTDEMDFIKRCIKVYWEYHSNRVHPDNQKDWNISQGILNK